MKKYLFLFPSLLLFTPFTKAQCPTAPITFANQAQINSFPTTYPNCTVIPDGVDIKIMGGDITDLSPLSQLTAALGLLEIRNCSLLQDLNGLHNITYLGNDALDGFILRDLPALNSLAALNKLDSVYGEFTIRTCNALNTLTGLNGFTKENGSLIIRDNGTLQDLNGLDSLVYIGETLELIGNPQLNSVASLGKVNTIVGGIEGGVFIEANIGLSNLTGLGNISTTIGSNLDITLNSNLNLCNVPSICKYLADPPINAVITISANKVDCNTQTEILAKCALKTKETNILKDNITASPNPFQDHFSISSKNSEALNIEVMDIFGTTLKKFNITGKENCDLTNYPSGIYILKFINSKGQETVIKILKL
ncbi:MAG: T9SS type A sorting domain-containing protein [Bacteroidia bacterium]